MVDGGPPSIIPLVLCLLVAVKMVQRVHVRASVFVQTFWSDISAD